MTQLGYMDKLNIQLQVNKENIGRSIDACEDANIDASYIIGQAIELFISTHNLYDFDDPDLRNEFHDAMHIVSFSYDSSPRSEAFAGVAEIALLREPYNGNMNDMLEQYRNSNLRGGYMQAAVRKFNSAGHEDFEKPAPVGSLKDALALGQERLHYTLKRQNSDEAVTEEEMTEVYNYALGVDEFFRDLMGGRAVYQLSSKELLETPLAFLGLEKTGKDDELSFAEIPQEKRSEIIANLEGQNTVLYQIEALRTVEELHSLGLELPDQPLPLPEL